jgi:hypothetical protein
MKTVGILLLGALLGAGALATWFVWSWRDVMK